LRKSLTSRYPTGMDPSRYEATTSRLIARTMIKQSLAGNVEWK
jgi:hypothetical protein